MKTLLFCTAYIPGNTYRYIDWINYYSEVYPEFDLLLVHDGPLDTALKQEIIDNTNGYVNDNNFKDFDTKLEREVHWVFPSWYRSFYYAIKVGQQNYDKIIHIESDAYIVSERLKQYMKEKNNGWVSMFSRKYGFPESAIQIINKDVFDLLDTLPEMYNFETHIEYFLPFTEVCKDFVGDRYGEVGKLPQYSIDYACQWNSDWGIPEDWAI